MQILDLQKRNISESKTQENADSMLHLTWPVLQLRCTTVGIFSSYMYLLNTLKTKLY